MTVTVSYSYNNLKPGFSAPFDASSNSNGSNPSLVALSNGNFYQASQWQNLATPANTSITGELFNGSGTEIGAYNSTIGVTNGDYAVAQLTNGYVLTTVGTYFSLTDPNTNTLVKPSTPLDGSASTTVDVAALKDGGFAVVVQSGTNTSPASTLWIYDANGLLIRYAPVGDHSFGADQQRPTVAVLNNGNIVVAYEQEVQANTFGMAIQMYRPDGRSLWDGTTFDPVGSIQPKPHVVALKDGGFAVAYSTMTQISVAFFNSDGVLRGIQEASSYAVDPVVEPSITVLANGNVAVTWTEAEHPAGSVIRGVLIDPGTMQKINLPQVIAAGLGRQYQSSIVGLADGTHVVSWTGTNNAPADGNDPNGTHVLVQIDAWTRNTTGTSDNEIFRGDGLRDVFTSGGGADTFVYARGGHADTISGFVPGAAGYDRVVLSGFNGVRSFADVASRASQVGSNTVIDFGNGDVLTLNNVNKLDLTADNFAIRTFDDGVSLYPSFGSDPSAGGWVNQNLTPRMMADVNGDGRADIVGFGESAAYVSFAKATGGFADATVITNSSRFSAAGGWTNNDANYRTMADVNGDGKADIVGFGSTGVLVSYTRPDGSFTDPFFLLASFGTDAAAGGWSSNDVDPRMVADVNGDGLADIVGFAGNGVWVALATADDLYSPALPRVTLGAPFLSLASFGADASAGGWTSDTQYHREMADVNGDGMADIVGFGSSATYVSLATGGGHFADPKIAIDSFGYAPEGGGWFTQDQYPRHLADVNGDGRADIVGFGDSTTYISYGNADGTFGDPIADLASFGRSAVAGGWASDSTLPRMLADVDGNGAADIVGFGNGGVYVAHSNVNWLG